VTFELLVQVTEDVTMADHTVAAVTTAVVEVAVITVIVTAATPVEVYLLSSY